MAIEVIRRRDVFNAYGYGVGGSAFSVEGTSRVFEIDMNNLALSIGRRVRNADPPNPSNFYPVTVRKLTWRAAISAQLFDDTQVIALSPIFSKKKFGRIVYESDGQNTGEEFWSYEKQIFRKNGLVQIDVNGFPDDRVPCNQPTREIDIDTLLSGAADPPYFADSATGFFPYRMGEKPSDAIGDKIRLFVEPGVFRVSFGVTFVYVNDAFELDEWLSALAPPRLIF